MSRFARSALVLLVLASAAPVGAQQADSTAALPSVLRRAASERWQVRVTALDSSTLQGRVWTVDRDSVRVGESRVAHADLAVLERMQRDNSGIVRGALIGGAVTAAIAGTFTAAMCEGRCNNGRVTAGAAVAGAFIFGAVGALVDPGDPSWQVIWRRSVDSSLRSE